MLLLHRTLGIAKHALVFELNIYKSLLRWLFDPLYAVAAR